MSTKADSVYHDEKEAATAEENVKISAAPAVQDWDDEEEKALV